MDEWFNVLGRDEDIDGVWEPPLISALLSNIYFYETFIKYFTLLNVVWKKSFKLQPINTL